MVVGAAEFVGLVALLMAVGALAGIYGHFARAGIGIDEPAPVKPVGAGPVDRFVQAYVFRADVDATGGWDLMSRRNMASMAVAGAMGPLVAGLVALSLLPA